MSTPKLTPTTVTPELMRASLLNVLMTSHDIDLQAAADVLQHALGERLGEPDFGEGTLRVEIDGNHLAHIMQVDFPPKEPAEAYRPHPVQSGELDLDAITGQLLVTLLPRDKVLTQGRQAREPRMVSLTLHAQVTAALASLKGVEAVHNTMADVTIGPGIFVEAVSQGDLTMALCSVWLQQTPTGINACTFGLANAGHPELVVESSSLDPTALYYKLLDITNHILYGATLKDGDTFAFAEGEDPLSISTATHPIAEFPALKLEL